ncbi:uncharacterized protein [Leuresthes tenuis]|uniref:uncharacterized protein n=1 Tax=Leuresthes tenuis TaxID=355514 RepID=UPI003B5066A9
MEACMVKPEVKKKPKQPKPPPKPSEIKRNDPERPERPAPVVPRRPTDAELSKIQYRMKRSATSNDETNGNLKQQETKEKPSETPVIPPRRVERELNATTRHSQHRKADHTKSPREADQPEAAVDVADFKQSALTGMFRRNPKEKMPTFTSYVIPTSEEEKTDDVTVKQAPSNKPGVLKGVMKGLQFKSSPKASREPSPDPNAEETGAEKEQPAEKNKQEKNAEPKQDRGGLLAGMFRKSPKEMSTSPALTVSKADGDPEDAEEEEKTSDQNNERGSFFSGILKKSNKPADETSAQENLSACSELSASSDSLSEHKVSSFMCL